MAEFALLAVEDLLERLKAVGVAHSLTPADLADGAVSDTLAQLFGRIISELFNARKVSIRTERVNTIAQIFQALASDPPYFDQSTANVKYKLIVHIISLIQTERLIQHNSSGVSAMEVDSTLATDDSYLYYRTEKVTNLLGLGSPDSLGGVGPALHAAADRITELKGATTYVVAQPRLRIFATPPVLNSAQQSKVKAVEEMLYKDFELRRDMLMKRMDLTVQSFLWSEKAQGCAEQIRQQVQARQRHLAVMPARYQLADALEASVTLLQEQCKRVTPSSTTHTLGAAAGEREGTKSIIKQVLVGDVPDRGGRANEVRSKQLREDVRRSFGNNFSSGSRPSHSRGGGGGGHGGGQGGGGQGGGGQGGGGQAGSSGGKGGAPSARRDDPQSKSGGGGDNTVGDKRGASTQPQQAADRGKKGGGGGGQGNDRGSTAPSVPASGGGGGGGGILERAASAGRQRQIEGQAGAGTGPSTAGGGGASGARVTTIVGVSSGSGSGRTVSVTVQEASTQLSGKTDGHGDGGGGEGKQQGGGGGGRRNRHHNKNK